MNERLAAWFPLLLLAALTALTSWLDRAVQPVPPGRPGSLRHDPDYFVDGLSAIRMAADGSIKHTLTARHMVHFPDDDTTHLELPHFATSETKRPPVTVSAKQAVLSSEGESIHFYDDVKATRAPSANKGELVMETSYLLVIPDDNIVRTDRPVTITEPGITIHAVGLELNSETRILKLLSSVRGTYHEAKQSARASGAGSARR